MLSHSTPTSAPWSLITHAVIPSIVLFRGNVTRRSDSQSSLLLANFDAVTDDLQAGAIVVIGDGRLRVRRLPIG